MSDDRIGATPPALSGTPRTGRKTLAGLGISALAIAGIYSMIPAEESGRSVRTTMDSNGTVQAINVRGNLHQRAYRDRVGVLTICDGDTHGVRVGELDTPEQCRARLETQLVNHTEPVIRCVPILGRFDFYSQLTASVDLAYNIGPAGFCHSSVAREANAHHWRAAADAFLLYNKAGGRVLPGLDARRHRERTLFLRGF